MDGETIPAWLGPETRFGPDLAERLLDSRVVFYPGAGNDLHPIEIFGNAGAAHCFINADYDYRDDQLPMFRNYRVVYAEDINFDNLAAALNLDATHPNEGQWQRFVTWEQVRNGRSRWIVMQGASAEVPKYLCLLQAFAEAVWFYQQFWASHRRSAYAILLQDHGFGLNWTSFGGDHSPLYQIARVGQLPNYLVVAENTTVWPGYLRKRPVGEGGSASHARTLFRRNPEAQTDFATVRRA